MKTTVPLKRICIVLSFPATLLLLSINSFAAPASYGVFSGVRDTILISKAQTSRKHKIRMYPNADQTVLFFSVSGESGKVYQLYLFDLDGRLAKQTQIRNKETTVLTNIVKGNYTFEIFSDDERIENGQMIIK
jgi:hypothetical protein